MKHPKSNLLETPYTSEYREKLHPLLKELHEKGIIRKRGEKNVSDHEDVHDVIADFLTHVFIHTKEWLTRSHGYSDRCPVQFVMTVPTIWSARASRTLDAAMQAALRAAKFGVSASGCIKDLYIITEPEAAATYLIDVSPEMLVSLRCSPGT